MRASRFPLLALPLLTLGALLTACWRDEAIERRDRLREEISRAPRDLREFVESLIDTFLRHLPGVLAGIAIFVLFWLLSRLLVRFLKKVMERARTDSEARELLLPLVRIGVLTVGLLMALDQMGFEVGSLLAGLGVAGLAVGLAAQETIANIIAGFSILWDRPFRLGDTVTIAGNQGDVTEIGLRSTRIRTLDHREVILPNKEVVRQAIVNHSRYPEARLVAAVTLAHGASVEAAREAILAAVRRQMPILDKPEPQAVVRALGETGVAMEVRVWIARPESAEKSSFRLLETTRAALVEAGIELARPIRLAVSDLSPPSSSPSATP